MLRLVFHLALRQAEGFAASVLRLLGQDLRVPDHTTLSRRSRGFAGRRPRVIPHGPLHLVIDSTGLKLFGQGEWDEEKHGRTRRSWRKLHLAVDAGTGEIVACVLTDNAADDAGQVPALLEAIEGEIASVTADGAYDGEPVYQAIASHQSDPAPDICHPASRARRCRARRALRRRANAIATSGSSRRRAAWLGRKRLATAGAVSRRPRSAATRRSSARSCAPASCLAQQGEAAMAAEVLNRMIRVAKPVSIRAT